MTILLTGDSGFLGQILLQEFIALGHTVETLGRHAKADIICDLATQIPKLTKSYDLVVHAAGKAHSIPKTEKEKQEFIKVNTNGTMHLLEALKGVISARSTTLVFMSTVAVYGVDRGVDIKEDHPLNGTSPYAVSKINAEHKILEWEQKTGNHAIVFRLPLLVGANPKGNLEAMIRAIHKGYYVGIGKGEARRSMVLAVDIAKFIPTVAGKDGIYNLTDGKHPYFCDIENAIALKLNKKIRRIHPTWIATFAKIGDYIPYSPIHTKRFEKMTSTLTFSDEKARRELGWVTNDVLENLG